MVFVTWLAFLTPSAFGVPSTSSQDAKGSAGVNQALQNGRLKPTTSFTQPNFSDRRLHRIALSDRGRSPFPSPARNLWSPQAGARCLTCTNRSPSRKSRRPAPSLVGPRTTLLSHTEFAP